MVTCKLRFCAERTEARNSVTCSCTASGVYYSSPLSQVSHFNNRFSPNLFSFSSSFSPSSVSLVGNRLFQLLS